MHANQLFKTSIFIKFYCFPKNVTKSKISINQSNLSNSRFVYKLYVQFLSNCKSISLNSPKVQKFISLLSRRLPPCRLVVVSHFSVASNHHSVVVISCHMSLFAVNRNIYNHCLTKFNVNV